MNEEVVFRFEVTEKFLLFYLTAKKRKFNLHFPKKPQPDMQVLPYLLTLESKSLDCLHSYCNLWEHFSDWLIKRSMVFTVESYRIVCTKLPFSSKPSTLVASWFKCPIYVSWRFPGKDSHRALNGGRIPEPSKSSKISVYLWNVRKCIIVVHNLDFYVMPNHQWPKIVSFEWSNITKWLAQRNDFDFVEIFEDKFKKS